MNADKMMWSVLIHLEMSFSPRRKNTAHLMVFDEEVWDAIIDECVKSGVNAIVLELARGVRYGSHPELAQPWAWSRERVKKEIKRLKDLGIELIPKLNFSATHDGWLMEYERMLSTPTYYRVCRDLILEVGELFDHPRYIHLGMDEEDARHAKVSELAVYRHKELYWHDLQYLCDCVREAGSTPWIWSCSCFSHPEEFRAHISSDDIVISPWMYNAIREEHKTPISSRQEYVEYYSKEPYASLNMQYVEDDPFIVKFMKQAIPCVQDGYKVVPCVSTYNQCPYNAVDMLEYFRDNADPDGVLGFMTAPWFGTLKENQENILNDIRVFKRAIDEMYRGKKNESAKAIDLSGINTSGINVY